MLLGGIYIYFRLPHYRVYGEFRLLVLIPLGIVPLTVPLSLLQRLMPRPTSVLA